MITLHRFCARTLHASTYTYKSLGCLFTELQEYPEYNRVEKRHFGWVKILPKKKKLTNCRTAYAFWLILYYKPSDPLPLLSSPSLSTWCDAVCRSNHHYLLRVLRPMYFMSFRVCVTLTKFVIKIVCKRQRPRYCHAQCRGSFWIMSKAENNIVVAGTKLE